MGHHVARYEPGRDTPDVVCLSIKGSLKKVVHALLKGGLGEGADVVEDMYGGNALYWANKRGHEMCAKILIGKNAGAGSGSDSNSSDEQEHLNDEEASKTPTLNSRGMGRSLFAHKYRRSSPQFHETT